MGILYLLGLIHLVLLVTQVKTHVFLIRLAGEEHQSSSSSVYADLMDEIQERKVTPVSGSYTNYLFKEGTDKIAKKLIEEAGEVIIAAKNADKEEIINETSDLLYHCLVLLADQGVSLASVEAELRKRSSKKGNAKQERPEIENW